MNKDRDKHTIYFDIGGVLLHPIHPPLIRNLYETSLKNINEVEYKNQVKDILNRSFHAEYSLEKTCEKLCNAVGTVVSNPVDYIISLITVIRNDDLILHIIEKIISCNKFNVGIISDLSQLGFFIVSTYYQDLLHLIKPDNIFFSVHTKKTKKKHKTSYFEEIHNQGKNKGNVYFIDDSIENIQYAKKIGMNGIIFEAPQIHDTSFSCWKKPNEKLFQTLDNIL